MTQHNSWYMQNVSGVDMRGVLIVRETCFERGSDNASSAIYEQPSESPQTRTYLSDNYNILRRFEMKFFDNPYKVDDTTNYIKKIYKFENGFGASIMRACGFITTITDTTNYPWHLAVLIWHADSGAFEVCYVSPLTNFVVLCDTDEKVEECLQEINNYPSRIGLLFNSAETDMLLEVLEDRRHFLAQKAWVCDKYGEEVDLIKGMIEKIQRNNLHLKV